MPKDDRGTTSKNIIGFPSADTDKAQKQLKIVDAILKIDPKNRQALSARNRILPDFKRVSPVEEDTLAQSLEALAAKQV
jgi:hypothetical protein